MYLTPLVEVELKGPMDLENLITWGVLPIKYVSETIVSKALFERDLF